VSTQDKEIAVIFEDNHLMVINKKPSQIVQGDKTGDTPLPELIKDFLKIKYNKPGNVFCGVVHRLDRPVSGVCVFAKTSKALTRLNEQFKLKTTRKTYWAIVEKAPKEKFGSLRHFLLKNEKQNKSYVVKEGTKDSKNAILHYKTLKISDNYTLLEIELETGRHHQIRCQLATIGAIIKGDLKYGAKRSNPDASICLHARSLEIDHPTQGIKLMFEAPVPEGNLWGFFEK
jgi:23S rRNA pseudouridine1911/1915/1917 synthase